MNRGQFFSNNKTTQEFIYKTNISSATTSNFIFSLLPTNIKKRIHYNPDYPGFNFFIQPNLIDNIFYLNQPINFNYSGDPGNVKTITVKSNDFSTVNRLTGSNQKIGLSHIK